MSKADKIKNFDPNNLGDKNANIYGLPFTTAKGPAAVFTGVFASSQINLISAERVYLYGKIVIFLLRLNTTA